jgi:hypothetical protein
LRDRATRTSARASASASAAASAARPRSSSAQRTFSTYADPKSSDLQQIFASLAEQLGRVVPGLDETIAKKKVQVADAPATNDADDLFAYLVAAPCKAVPPPTDLRVVIITLAPDWLGFLLTTRPEEYDVEAQLGDFRPTVLDAEQEKNEDDLRAYFTRRLQEARLGLAKQDQPAANRWCGRSRRFFGTS